MTGRKYSRPTPGRLLQAASSQQPVTAATSPRRCRARALRRYLTCLTAVSCGAKPVQGRQAVDSQALVDVALPFLSESRLHVRRRCGEVEKTDGCRWFSVGCGVSPFASCFRRCRKLLKKERRTRERKWSATHSPISRPSRAGNSSNGSAVHRPGCLARCIRFRWTDPQIVPIPSLTVGFSLAGLSRWALCSTWFSRQGLQADVPPPCLSKVDPSARRFHA